MSEQRALPAVYHLALTKAQLELVATVTCNLIAMHATATDAGAGFRLVNSRTATEEGARTARAAVPKLAREGIIIALARATERMGPLGLYDLANGLNALMGAAAKQEGNE